jgi:hypothetical protein
MEVKEINTTEIVLDHNMQCRAKLSVKCIDDYTESYRTGAKFPPIIVFSDGKNHFLADGFHRVEAARKAGIDRVLAEIREGDRRQAILHAVGANLTHGLRRTNGDKRKAVTWLLTDAEWSQWSDREIAKRCGVAESVFTKQY